MHDSKAQRLRFEREREKERDVQKKAGSRDFTAPQEISYILSSIVNKGYVKETLLCKKNRFSHSCELYLKQQL